jgi:hypothetical protein
MANVEEKVNPSHKRTEMGEESGKGILARAK